MFFIYLCIVLNNFTMYQTLTFLHSTVRWFVLLSLLYSIYIAYKGFYSGKIFSKTDNSIRHWTATIAHIQLIIGITFYTQSPIIKYFFNNFNVAIQDFEMAFFGLIHGVLMLIAIVILTIGSAMSKRKATDREKFKTMLIWFSTALFIILIAIPWPFSPLAHRPYFR